MQYDIRWIRYDQKNLIIELSKDIYEKNSKVSYSPNLNQAANPNEAMPHVLDLFLIPPAYLGSDQRKIIGVFDENNQLVMATGVRCLLTNQAWVLSWTLSKIKDFSFKKVWQQHVQFACEYFENIGYKEFWTVSPVSRESAYRSLMLPMREKYWTFVEFTVPQHQRTDFSLYWSLMGNRSYPYDINIRRYIMKRD